MNPQAITQILQSLFGPLFGQGQPGSAQASVNSTQPQASSSNTIAQAIPQITKSQEHMQQQMLQSVFGQTIGGHPVSKTAINTGAPAYHGLNDLYKANPQMGGLIIDDSGSHMADGSSASNRPNAQTHFNNDVFQNPSGPPAYQPPTGSVAGPGGQTQPMSPADIFGLLGGNQGPNPSFGSGSLTPPGTPATVTQNGVQSPLNLFMQGAHNAGSTNFWQSGLTPQQRQQLMGSPLFGPAANPTYKRL